MLKKNIRNVDDIITAIGVKTTQHWKKLLTTLPPYQLGIIRLKASGIGHHLIQFADELSYLRNSKIIVPVLIDGSDIFKDDLKQYRNFAQKLKSFLPSSKIFADLPVDDGLAVLDTKPLIRSIIDGEIPIMIPASSGAMIDIDSLMLLIARHLNSHKLILVGQEPLISNSKGVIDEIRSLHDLHKISKLLRKDEMERACRIYDMLLKLGPGHSVQITAMKKRRDAITSTGLLEELLGEGDGTMIAYPNIISSYPIEAIEKEQVGLMIDAIFSRSGKTLVEDYFNMISKLDPVIYLDTQHRGGAVVYKIGGIPYLCKLFTNRDFEGLGIASSIMESIILNCGKVCFRTSNPLNVPKYMSIIQRYSGIHAKGRRYHLFFIGMNKDEIKRMRGKVERLPPTLRSL